ncbi:MAG: iron-containing alcohol dehydrogenase [Lachnospiraceae bacterium]|nr:iron-containing alcohol dehydrogenase [Lachnospiraceae bacterium]
MNNFEFYTPTHVYFGRGQEEKVGQIVKSYGFQKVLVHFGGGSARKSGLLDKIEKQLTENGIAFVELGGVQANPVLSMVRKGIEVCRAENVDLILAIGGGSVIDSSKAIADGYANPDVDVWDLISQKVKLTKSTPVATVLTLAASGSEMSNSAVITNEDGMLKRGYGSPYHRPLFSIMNPELTYSVSKYQTACGAVDIMMHTLERYFCLNQDNDLTDRLAEGLLTAVIRAGRIAVEDPENYEARATLMWAGSLSHNDITGSGRQYMMQVHQIEHELSGYDDKIAHGAGLAVLWPAWARFQAKNAPERFAQYAVRVWGCEMNFHDPYETALEGIDRTQAYFTSLGMPSRLREFGIPEEACEVIAENTTFHGKRILPDYQDLDKPEILEILKACY